MSLQSLIVNRHLQRILQHPQFFKLCNASDSAGLSSRDSIIRLLHMLFHAHPANTCQITHISPLIRVYMATCSLSDRQLLSIFRLFETQRKTSLASLVAKWSPSPDVTSSSALDGIHNLDPARVLRTCLAFPNWRRLQDLAPIGDHSVDAQVYDPAFLILLFACMLSRSPPASAMAWVELFRTNIVCLLIRCMSSKDDHMRDLALCQIVALRACLEVIRSSHS
jgi:nucleolar pre-ribosomal-associated protein 1